MFVALDNTRKLSYTLVQHHDLIACKDASIRTMLRNTHLNKSILDACALEAARL